jgi:hypothetical protein
MATHGDQRFLGVTDLASRISALAEMVQIGLVDPWSTEWVTDVVRGLPHGNIPGVDRLEVNAVFNALKSNVRYTFHPGMDRIQSLRWTLEHGVADCDNGAVALATALTLLNFRVAWVIMGASRDTADHIWTQVWLPRGTNVVDGPAGESRWVNLDLTTGPGGTPDSAVVGYSVPLGSRAWWQRVKLKLT